MEEWDDEDWTDDGKDTWDDEEEWDDGGWDKDEDMDGPDGPDGSKEAATYMDSDEVLNAMIMFSTYSDPGMQDWLWLTHLAGMATWLGWLVQIPIGGVIYTWLFIKAFFIDIWPILETEGEDVQFLKPYMMGPVRRAVMGSFIFGMNVAWATIPGLSILTSLIFAYWGVADYYDYNYDFETFTPLMPMWATEAGLTEADMYKYA